MSEEINAISDTIDFGLAYASKEGAIEAEGYGIYGIDVGAEIEKGKPTFENGIIQGLSFRVIVENQIGFAFTRSLNKQKIQNTIISAIHNARSQAAITENPVTIHLPDPRKSSFSVKFDPTIRSLSLDSIDEGLERLIAGCEKAPAYMHFLGGQVGAAHGHMIIRNTNGIDSNHELGFGIAVAYLLTTKGLLPSYDIEFEMRRSLKAMNYEEVAERVIAGTERGTNPRGINFSNESTTIILEPEAMGMIFSSLGAVLQDMLKGDQIFNGDSHFSDRIGEQVASECFSFIDNPHHPTSPLASAFDMEGVPTKKTALIEKGILKEVYLDNKYANLMNLPSNGKCTRFGMTPDLADSVKNAPRIGPTIMEVPSGSASKDELITETKEGFIFKNLMGVHSSDYSSGRFSVTGNGWFVKNGKILFPVQDVTFSGTVPDLLKNIDLISKERKNLGSAELPWIRVKDMKVTSKRFSRMMVMGLRTLKTLTFLRLMKNPFV